MKQAYNSGVGIYKHRSGEKEEGKWAGIDGKGRQNDFCLYRAYQQVGISRQVIAKIRAIVD